jgi:hypothetical protein
MYKLPVYYTLLDYKQRKEVRLQYISEQEGMCCYCKEKLDSDPPSHIISKKINLKLFPTGFLNSPVHLQHNHDTGMTEGAVHAYCNAVMWQYEGK